MNAIIGYTGFVGNILKDAIPNCDYYNSENIEEIKGKKYTNVFCCGISSLRWLANKNPDEDFLKIVSLLNSLAEIEFCHKFILVSTVAIHDNEPYGENRKFAEETLLEMFNNISVYRLPSVFGKGLKKNMLHDILTNNLRQPVNINDEMQWYNVDNLYNDIIQNFDNGIYELYPEPLKNADLVELFDKPVDTINSDKRMYKTIKPETGYWYTKDKVKENLKIFIETYGNS